MPPVEDSAAFPSLEHLKSSLQIKHVMEDDHTFFAFPIKCFYRFVPKDTPADLQLAVMVPKKRFHHAVDRNRIKRLMRECYRLNKSSLVLPPEQSCQMCWIFVAHEMPTFGIVEKAVVSIFQNLSSTTEKQV